jgi:alpha-ketoglutarate-dependent taurine dioxygenase
VRGAVHSAIAPARLPCTAFSILGAAERRGAGRADCAAVRPGEKALYLNLARQKGVVGLPEAEGVALITRLQQHCDDAAPKYQHRYTRGDLLIWDNALVQHRAHENYREGEPRVLWQLFVAGERPF